jgi:hypothetical protein
MKRRRGRALRRRYGRSASSRNRKRDSLAGARYVIHNANPGDKSWTNHNFILWFGSHAPTYVRAWGNSLDDALDEAVDYIADRWPGLLSDSEVSDEYNRLIADGVSEDEASEESEADTTTAGNSGNHLRSDEWGIAAEDPTREQVLALQERGWKR